MDVSHNHFTDREEMLKSLKTMPALRDLKLNIPTDEEGQVIKALPL